MQVWSRKRGKGIFRKVQRFKRFKGSKGKRFKGSKGKKLKGSEV